MGDINIKQLESLRWRMRVIETLTVIGTAWIALAVYQKKEELVYYLVGAVVLLFLLKYYTQFRLRKRQFVSNLVEQRTSVNAPSTIAEKSFLERTFNSRM